MDKDFLDKLNDLASQWQNRKSNQDYTDGKEYAYLDAAEELQDLLKEYERENKKIDIIIKKESKHL